MHIGFNDVTIIREIDNPLKRVLAILLTTEGASDSLHAGRMAKLSGYRIRWIIISEGIYLLTERTANGVVRFFYSKDNLKELLAWQT